jgi:Autographiviridae endonuclease VII
MDEEKRARRDEKENRRRRELWATDPEYREKKKAENRARYHANKEEICARARERRATDPEWKARINRSRIKHYYGLSIEDLEMMRAQQNDACSICHRPFTVAPSIDHCHVTGLVRGLLCAKCNFGLGNFEDNLIFLIGAIHYLGRWFRPPDPTFQHRGEQHDVQRRRYR